MEEIEEQLASIAAQIEGRLKNELAPYIWDAKKNVVVKPFLEGTDYQFNFYIEDEIQGASNSTPRSRFPPSDNEIEQIIELLILGFNIRRGDKNRRNLKDKNYSDHQLIMLGLAQLLYKTDDLNGLDASLACILYERI